MKQILRSNMHWILLVMLVFLHFSFVGIGTWNLNRTIGWGWEFEFYRWSTAVTKSSIFLFTIGYGILKVYGKTPRFGFSLLHLILILIFLWIPVHEVIPNLLVGLLAWGVFIGNFIVALKSDILE